MIYKSMVASVAAATVFSFGAANAATVENGETFCDSLNQQLDNSSCLNLGGGDQDLGQTPNKVITFKGDGMLKGWVRDANGQSSNFADAAKIVLTKDSYLSFDIFDTDPGFQGTLTFGSETAKMGLGAGFNIGVGPQLFLAGTYDFIFDATDPNESQTNTTEYKLTVSAVPLPAAAWLMLAGLGGIAAVSRRKS